MLVEILLRFAAIISTALASPRASAGAAMLLMPSVAWVGVATFLNVTTLILPPAQAPEAGAAAAGPSSQERG